MPKENIHKGVKESEGADDLTQKSSFMQYVGAGRFGTTKSENPSTNGHITSPGNGEKDRTKASKIIFNGTDKLLKTCWIKTGNTMIVGLLTGHCRLTSTKRRKKARSCAVPLRGPGEDKIPSTDCECREAHNTYICSYNQEPLSKKINLIKQAQKVYSISGWQ